MTKKHHLSRRRFLKSSALALTAPLIIPSFARAAERAANDRIQVGFIGMGTQGRGLLSGLLGKSDARVVAVCDVDATRRDNAQRLANERYAEAAGTSSYSGVAAYSDFRELLARDDIDAVVIATPDHWHAFIAIAAARAGKDIYCEKPLCQSVNEALRLVEVMREHGRVFQTGSQQRSEIRFRMACEWVRNGRIGNVQRVDVALPVGIARWCDLPEAEAPDALDWDLWLGPAPERGWHADLSPVGVHGHFPHWRHYREYGGGMVTDWGAHHFDIVQWALGMDESGPVHFIPAENRNATTGARFFYRNGVEVTHLGGNGITFYGDEGEIFVNRGAIDIRPEEKRREPLADDAIRLYESNDHFQNWLDCIRSREKPICDVEVGARSVIVCHLVNMTYWHGRRFAWDPVENRFFAGSGNAEWLDVPYRDPWQLT